MDLEEASARRVGQTLKDKWVLEQLLGVGGMASVYLARHKIGRLEAIKILHAEIAASEQLRARFEQEARAVNALRHPGVVEVRDIDVTEDGAPFLVMELLEGESLAARARREPPLALPEVLRIAAEMLDALGAVHAHGIIHRDIKPDNVFLTRDGKVKVLDFGIARVRSGGPRALATEVGTTLGTMAYMPPEQARGLEIDARADLYAVGATIFRLLGDRIVHDGSTDAERVMKAMTEPAPPLASVAPSAPADVCAVVDRALAFDRADRYPDAATMKADVEAAARGEALPYASKAPPLPTGSPSSEMFALRESFFGDVPAASAPREQTFVPPAKAAARTPASTPNVIIAPASTAKPTTAGVAPEVAPTRLGAVAVPSNAMPSARAMSQPTVISGGVGAPAPPVASEPQRVPPPLIYGILGAAVLVFVLMGAIAAIVVTRACFASPSSDPESEPAAAPAPTPTARTAPAPTSKQRSKKKKDD